MGAESLTDPAPTLTATTYNGFPAITVTSSTHGCTGSSSSGSVSYGSSLGASGGGSYFNTESGPGYTYTTTLVFPFLSGTKTISVGYSGGASGAGVNTSWTSETATIQLTGNYSEPVASGYYSNGSLYVSVTGSSKFYKVITSPKNYSSITATSTYSTSYYVSPATSYTVTCNDLYSDGSKSVYGPSVSYTIAGVQPLSAPSITLSNITSNSIGYSIGSVAGAGSYQIQYATNTSFSNATTLTAASGTISGLSANTTYYFRAKAVASSASYSDSSWSSRTSATTAKVPLSTPTELTLSPVSATQLSVSFSKVTNANQYIIEYSTSSSFTNKQTMTIQR